MSSSFLLSRDATVAVIGAGAMGAGIAQVAAVAGHHVVLHDARPEAAIQAISGIEAALKRLAEKGKLPAAEVPMAVGRLQAATTLADCAPAALVIEAIVEDLAAKHELFIALEAITTDTAILATNTSSISVTRIGARLRRPERLVGMHFFNPAPVMQLVEVVSGVATDPAAAAAVFTCAQAWGKVAVHTRSTPGFIVNRVARPFYAEGLRLLTEGAADAVTLDAVLREAGGFRMGPFELMDLIGHDVNYAVTRSVFDAFYGDPRFAPSITQLELVDAGHLGRKSGKGFYDYGIDTTPPAPRRAQSAEAPSFARVYAVREAVTGGQHSTVCSGFVARLAHVPGVSLVEAPIGATELEAAACRLVDIHEADDAVLYLSDGRTATERARQTGQPNTLLLDLAFDYSTSRRVALACADGCSPRASDAMIGLLQRAGWVVTLLDDAPGLAVLRTVAVLANEAAETVLQGVCSAEAVDLAMQKGVNYPIGPLAWAERLGFASVCRTLENLQKTYGEDRYRCSAWLRRKAWADAPQATQTTQLAKPTHSTAAIATH